LSIYIKIYDEDKCIHLFCSLPDSCDSLVVAIGSNSTTLTFDDVVSSLLSEEMRWTNMEKQSTNDVFARGCSEEINISKSSSGRSKYRGISKSPKKRVKVCWRCEKEGHYNKQCRPKRVYRGKVSEDAPCTKAKTFVDIGGDVYLYFSRTHVNHEA
jgi:hypothetical protein